MDAELSRLVDALPGLIWTARADGHVDFINQRWCEYTGLTPVESRGEGWRAAVHVDDLPVALSRWLSIAVAGTAELELRLRRWDGQYRWFLVQIRPVTSASGEIVKWCAINSDIDDRKSAESARAHARNLGVILDTMPALAWSALPDGLADFFNQNFLDYLGLTQEEARGHGWAATVHPDDRANLLTTWQAILTSERPGEAEARLRRFDGEYRWFLFRANPLRDELGRIVSWFGVNTDIDDRKHAEQVRLELAHMTRVASLGALTASVAHEVNQPLSGIINNANTCLRMLASEPPNVEGARETARRTIRDGNRAANVITRLRALFTKKGVTTERVDLNEATREVIALSTSELQRARVLMRAELAEGLPPVVGDRVQLQQVILNLLLNASAAMSSVEDRSRQLSIRTEPDEGEFVRLMVRDAGVGLDPRAVEQLFEPFYATKTGGMGIGLSVSRSIIEGHGGRLWVETNDGPGATFYFSVPCASGRVVDASACADVPAEAVGSPEAARSS